MDAIHLGDRTSGCDTCAKNDYINEILEENRWTHIADTMTGALEAWVANAPWTYLWEEHNDWIGDFEEAYEGEWESAQAFADQLADDTITGELPEVAQIYFDYEKFARDLFVSDYWESNGYIFRAH